MKKEYLYLAIGGLVLICVGLGAYLIGSHDKMQPSAVVSSSSSTSAQSSSQSSASSSSSPYTDPDSKDPTKATLDAVVNMAVKGVEDNDTEKFNNTPDRFDRNKSNIIVGVGSNRIYVHLQYYQNKKLKNEYVSYVYSQQHITGKSFTETTDDIKQLMSEMGSFDYISEHLSK